MGDYTYVAAGYIQLAEELTRLWGARATAVAARLDAGDYDADALATDLNETARLSARTAFLLASEATEALAVLAMPATRRNVVWSRPYRTPLEAAEVVPTGPLVHEGDPSTGTRPLLVTAVTKAAPEGGTAFQLTANATGYPIGPYFGTVAITAPAGVAQMDVNVTVGWGA